MKKGDLILQPMQAGFPMYIIGNGSLALRIVDKVDGNSVVFRRLTDLEMGSRKVKRLIKEMAK